MKYIRPAVLVFLAFYLSSCSVRKSNVDLVLLNGDIQTLDSNFPEAEAVAVDGGRIVGVGTNSAVESHFSGRITIDLHGAYVLPGLTDGHAHILELGMSLRTLDLTSARSPQEAARLVEEATARTRLGGWIRGSGWDAASWRGQLQSMTGLLDKAAPDNFVLLVSADGGAVWVNSKVLELAGVTRTTKSPEGGQIIKDSRGNLTGVLTGSAVGLITHSIPAPSESEIEDAILAACDTCARYGLTEVQDAGVDSRTLEAYRLLADQGRLKLRVYAMYDGNDSTLPAMLKKGILVDYKDYLTMRAVRVDMDGPLRTRQAALVREYSDAPGQYGSTNLGEKDLENLTIASLSSGFQVCTEARGDRACDVALNAYEKALRATGESDARLRIEGTEVLLTSDVPRFSALGILPSSEANDFASSMFWLESRLGSRRIRNAYPWQALIQEGAVIIGGSGFPENSVDPRLGIYTSIARKDMFGNPKSYSDARKYFELTADAAADSSLFDGGFVPREGMTLDQALKSFTVWPAYGAFQEKTKGTISVGKYADFTLFKSDLRRIPVGAIPADEVLATLVGGHLVYISPSAGELSVK